MARCGGQVAPGQEDIKDMSGVSEQEDIQDMSCSKAGKRFCSQPSAMCWQCRYHDDDDADDGGDGDGGGDSGWWSAPIVSRSARRCRHISPAAPKRSTQHLWQRTASPP